MGCILVRQQCDMQGRSRWQTAISERSCNLTVTDSESDSDSTNVPLVSVAGSSCPAPFVLCNDGTWSERGDCVGAHGAGLARRARARCDHSATHQRLSTREGREAGRTPRSSMAAQAQASDVPRELAGVRAAGLLQGPAASGSGRTRPAAASPRRAQLSAHRAGAAGRVLAPRQTGAGRLPIETVRRCSTAGGRCHSRYEWRSRSRCRGLCSGRLGAVRAAGGAQCRAHSRCIPGS